MQIAQRVLDAGAKVLQHWRHGIHPVAVAVPFVKYATLTLAGTRLSLAEQGHLAEDRPGVVMTAPEDPRQANVVLVVEIDDARAEHRRLVDEGVQFLAEPYEPPWGGCRFFCVDPDGYLVELEQPA